MGRIRMRRLMLFVTLTLTIFTVNAQIGGISGSKLAAYCVDVVDHNHFEFEPGLYQMKSGTAWTVNGNLYNLHETPDSLDTDNGMYLRLTYGLWDKMEIGGTISGDLIASNWGMRVVLFQKEKLGLATIAGINFPIASQQRNKHIDLSDADYSFGGGLVSTVDFTENLSLDVTAQYVMPFNTENWQQMSGQIYNMDLGYYVQDRHLQLIGGLGYSRINDGEGISELVTMCYGVTIETERFIIVACIPTDIYGANSIKSNGALLAMTLTF